MAAIDQIVDAYVRVGHRQALEQLLDDRKELADQIRDRSDFNFSVALGEIDKDILAISAGLDRIAGN